LLALAVGVATSGCCTPRAVEVIQCVDPDEETMAQFTDLPADWQDWYWNDYDPLCEALYNAAH
jgi:hypothetical protein